MLLNDAAVNRFTLDGKDYSNSIKGFLNALLNSDFYNAELVINNHIIPAGSAKFTLNSGWVYANVTAKLSFGETVHSNHLTVMIYDNKDNEQPIVESSTDALYTINENDVEAKLCFVVGSVFPYNELKKVVPDSRFVSLGTANFPVRKLNEYSTLADGIEVVDRPTVRVTINTTAVTEPSSEDTREIANLIYTYNATSHKWQSHRWGSTLDCLECGENFIVVGVYTYDKEVYVEPSEGLEERHVDVLPELLPEPDPSRPYEPDFSTLNISSETGASKICMITFMPIADTTLTVGVNSV